MVSAFEAFGCDVGINLCCREAGVAEYGLDAAQVCSGIEDVCGKGVTEFVWGEVGGETGSGEMFFHCEPDGTYVYTFAGFIEE